MEAEARIDGGEICGRCLQRAGIDHVFVLHGGHLDPIFQACLDLGIRLIDARHEAAAGHAADAYARQTGRTSVVLATAGPGFTNVLTAVAQAYLDCTPMLVIVGAPPLRDVERWPLQGGIDQVAVARPMTKSAIQVTRTELIPHLMGHALREAVDGRPGPVLLEIPIDVLFGSVAEKEVIWPVMARPARPAPHPHQVREILSTLAAAERPAILCGGGMLYGHGAAALRVFAGRSGIPVYANNKARGMMPAGHPFCAGAHTNMKIAEASGLGGPDVLLVLGARFGMFTEPGMLGPGRMPRDDCRIIQVDVCSTEIGRIRPVHLGVQADCHLLLEALAEASAGIDWPDWSGWMEVVRRIRSWHESAYEQAAETSRGSARIHPYEAVTEVMRVLGENTIVCADGGEASYWAELVATPQSPGGLMSHGYLGCLGIGVPFAIGAQLAHPERRVAVITGDGSFGFNLQELDTLVRHELPVITIVLNNKAWGMCVHGQQAMYGGNRLVATRLGDARYDLAARGLGCYGERAERLADIAPALQRALASGLPACIEIATDLDAVPAPLAEPAAAKRAEGEVVLPYYDA